MLMESGAEFVAAGVVGGNAAVEFPPVRPPSGSAAMTLVDPGAVVPALFPSVSAARAAAGPVPSRCFTAYQVSPTHSPASSTIPMIRFCLARPPPRPLLARL